MTNWYKIAVDEQNQKTFNFYNEKEVMSTPTNKLKLAYQEWINNGSPKDVRSIEELIEETSNYQELVGILKNTGTIWRKIDFANESIITIDIDKNKYLIEDFDFPNLIEANKWLYRLYDNDMERLIPSNEDNDYSIQFWNSKYHDNLYHATDEENVQSILQNGLTLQDKTRGLNNRGTGKAIFTSSNPDDISSYGDVIFEINVHQMAKDGYTPEVSVELQIGEEQTRSRIAHKIGLEYREQDYSTEGIYETTVIFYGNIPPKYLKKL
jgi:hypothetical protein